MMFSENRYPLFGIMLYQMRGSFFAKDDPVRALAGFWPANHCRAA
jgi:hypothetical protein